MTKQEVRAAALEAASRIHAGSQGAVSSRDVIQTAQNFEQYMAGEENW